MSRGTVFHRRTMLALAWLLGGYAFFLLLVFLSQRRLMYPAPRGSAAPDVGGARLERPEPAVCALYVAAERDQPIVVHFHGNGEDLGHQEQIVRALSAHGLGVLQSSCQRIERRRTIAPEP